LADPSEKTGTKKKKKQRDPELLTLPGRRARSAAMRETARDRDSARLRLAEELAESSGFTIPPDKGFLVVPPGGLELGAEVVDAGNALIDSIGHDRLISKKTKGGFLAQDLLDAANTPLDSPYMQFALSEEVVGPIAAYLGVLPVLNTIDVWYSAHAPKAPRSSQLWHLDIADITQVKVWVHLSDIDAKSGPLTVLDAATSDALADRIDYDFDERHRVPDEQVLEAGVDGLAAFEGPAGTVDFVDTSRCFHFGSRVDEGGVPRRIFVAQYLTPYAFRWEPDYRGRTPLRELAAESSSEFERLLLGAD
jgi:hypothetical protein